MAIWDWSKTAATNTTLEGVSWAEGMSPAGVNNGARAIAAALKEWQEDIGCSLTSGGSANVQTLTTNGALASLADGVLLGFTAGFTNTGATTLNVDTLGAQDVRKIASSGLVALSAGDIVAGGKYLATYETTGADWVLLNPTGFVRAVRTQQFTASGTYTPDANLLYAMIECVGGGGAGGGAAGSANSIYSGGGGGSGSYSRKRAIPADIGASQTVTIGAAGAAATAGANNGGAGGDTSIGTLCVGKGGSGGNYSSVAQVGTGGLGGIAGTGDVTAIGNPGLGGFYADGILVVASASGAGGGSPFGGGGRGVYGVTSGVNGSRGGGGSGGCIANVAGGNAAGGAGGAGFVVITEYCSA